MKTGRLMFVAMLCVITFASLALPQETEAQTNGSRRLEFVYAVNQDSNTISAFRRVGNGTLMLLQTPSFPTGNAPNGVAVNPAGTFAYVVNILSNDVSG